MRAGVRRKRFDYEFGGSGGADFIEQTESPFEPRPRVLPGVAGAKVRMDDAGLRISEHPRASGPQACADHRQCSRHHVNARLQAFRAASTLQCAHRVDARVATPRPPSARAQPRRIGLGGGFLARKLGHQPPAIRCLASRLSRPCALAWVLAHACAFVHAHVPVHVHAHAFAHQGNSASRAPAGCSNRQCESVLGFEHFDLDDSRGRGKGFEPQPSFLDHRQCAQRTDIEFGQVVTRHIFHNPGTASGACARGHRRVDPEHGIANRTESSLARAARCGRENAPHRTASVRWIQWKQPALGFHRARKVRQGGAGQNLNHAIGGIEFDDPIQSSTRKGDGDAAHGIAEFHPGPRTHHECRFPAAGKHLQTGRQLFAILGLHPGPKSGSPDALRGFQRIDAIARYILEPREGSATRIFAHSKGTAS